jgi:hypothetical protein
MVVPYIQDPSYISNKFVVFMVFTDVRPNQLDDFNLFAFTCCISKLGHLFYYGLILFNDPR